jgi:hypothetical protein
MNCSPETSSVFSCEQNENATNSKVPTNPVYYYSVKSLLLYILAYRSAVGMDWKKLLLLPAFTGSAAEFACWRFFGSLAAAPEESP